MVWPGMLADQSTRPPRSATALSTPLGLSPDDDDSVRTKAVADGAAAGVPGAGGVRADDAALGPLQPATSTTTASRSNASSARRVLARTPPEPRKAGASCAL